MQDWQDIQVFLALYRHKSARTVAPMLSRSHSTVLRRLETLEAALGARLFDRTPSGFQPTSAALRIVEDAKTMEAAMTRLQRSVAGADGSMAGEVRLTVPPVIATTLLLPMLADFKDLYPEVHVSLNVTDAFTDLSSRDADMAIRFTDNAPDHLIGRRLPDFRDGVYASPAYIERLIGPESSLPPEWIAWSNTKTFRARVSKMRFGECSVAWTFPSIDLQAEAAANGLGMALLPCVVGDARDDLVRIPGTKIHSVRTGWILYHAELRKMERVARLGQYLFEAFATLGHRAEGRSGERN